MSLGILTQHVTYTILISFWWNKLKKLANWKFWIFAYQIPRLQTHHTIPHQKLITTKNLNLPLPKSKKRVDITTKKSLTHIQMKATHPWENSVTHYTSPDNLYPHKMHIHRGNVPFLNSIYNPMLNIPQKNCIICKHSNYNRIIWIRFKYKKSDQRMR